MFEYELHQMRTAELARHAAHDQLAREARRVRGAARRSAGDDAGGRVSAQFRKARFTRAA